MVGQVETMPTGSVRAAIRTVGLSLVGKLLLIVPGQHLPRSEEHVGEDQAVSAPIANGPVVQIAASRTQVGRTVAVRAVDEAVVVLGFRNEI